MNAGKLKPIVLLLVLLSLSMSKASNAQLSAEAQERVAAVIPVLQLLLLDEDIERVEQPALDLDETSITLFSGATFTNIVSGGAGSGVLVFSTSDDTVASVDAVTGLVTGVNAGMATVSVFKRGDRLNLDSAPVVFTVLVMDRLSQSPLGLADNDLVLDINTTATNVVTGGDGEGAISYTSLSPLIATVDSVTGLITGIAAGVTTITVSKAGDASFMDATPIMFTVTVNKLAQGALIFGQSSLSLQTGSTGTNLASGGNGTGAINYTSSAPLVASVDAATGEVTAVSEGGAAISATRAGDATFIESAAATYQVLVTESSVADCVWDQTNWDDCNWQ